MNLDVNSTSVKNASMLERARECAVPLLLTVGAAGCTAPVAEVQQTSGGEMKAVMRACDQEHSMASRRRELEHLQGAGFSDREGVKKLEELITDYEKIERDFRSEEDPVRKGVLGIRLSFICRDIDTMIDTLALKLFKQADRENRSRAAKDNP